MLIFLASQISSLCGRDRFTTQEEAIYNYLCRFESRAVSKMMKHFKAEDRHAEIYDELSKGSVAQETIEQPAVAVPSKVMNDEFEFDVDIEKIYNELEIDGSLRVSEDPAIVPPLESEESLRNEIVDSPGGIGRPTPHDGPVEREKHLADGVDGEIDAISLLRSEGSDIREQQEKFAKYFATDDNLPYMIVGRVDGIIYLSGARSEVLEIKYRINRFPFRPYKKDVDQICIYSILTGLPTILVEMLKGTKETRRNHFWHGSPSALDMWAEIKTELDIVAHKIVRMCENPESEESAALLSSIRSIQLKKENNTIEVDE